jgi:DNA-cytosine methyltransferase
MVGNAILNNAKYSSNTDEWYTTYDTIAQELTHYENQFRNKIVLCNCDDPFESNFSYYFLKNFNRLGLRKLICTSYGASRINTIKGNIPMTSPVFDEIEDNLDSKNGCVLIISNVPGKGTEEISDSIINKILRKKGVVKKLKGNGDFRSDECLEYLKQCDICCTNPPFSLFAELFSLLVKYNKHYLLIGNQNAITYKEIFPYIKENKVWVGYRFGDMSFRVPNNTEPRKTRFWIDSSGQKWRSLGNVMWLTNLDIPKRHTYLELTQKYSPEKYPKYDNFDAINVKRVADIPMDYDGVMGVPITFLKHHNGLQFKIVGEANHGSDNEFDLFKPKIDGKEIFKRILIRKINKRKEKMIFNILDLFCGAGGLSYGMDKNKHFHTKVAIDFDEKAAETFKKNIPDAKVVVGDITDCEVKKKIINLSQNANVNMIVGGPPCQGYSMKGKKLGLKDPRNFLFREYLNLVKEMQPEVFVIENVKGLLLASNGWFKDEILNAVSDMGYWVEYGILNAADFGVPQSRERAIFICSKNNVITLPTPTVSKYTTVRDAISDLSYLESREGDFKQNYITKAESDYQKMMRDGSLALYNHKASNHKKIAIEKLKMIPPEQGKEFIPKELQGKQKFKTTWGRLKWDNVSPTIDTRFDASSNGTNNHPYLNRAITPREAARIQSFDDKFVFYGSKVYVRKQIGNAVPPLLAKAIADKIDKVFNS